MSIDNIGDFANSAKPEDGGVIIASIAKNLKFTEYSTEIINRLQNGDNYSSITQQAIISGKKSDKSTETIKVFIKRAPQNEDVRDSLKSSKAYKNELMSFNYLIPSLYKLQDEIGMSVDERFKVPRALAMSIEDHKEFVAMEDISVRNFRAANRMESLDYNHLRLLIKRIANFHGTGMVLKHKKPDIYEDIAKDLSHDIYYQLGVNNHFITWARESLKYNKLFMNDEQKQKVNRLFENLEEFMDYLTSRKAAQPYDIICHGDLWISNFWFNYNEDDVPVDVCFFDWQLLRCGSLFTDLHYMVFLCTDSNMRKKYHKDIYDWYYADLGKVLDAFGLNLATIYPKDHFKADEKKFSAHALVVALVYTLPMTADPNNAPDISELICHDPEKVKRQLVKISDKGKQRIRDIISDYISYGYA